MQVEDDREPLIPATALLRIRELVQEQHCRVSFCLRECLACHDQILHNLSSYHCAIACENIPEACSSSSPTETSLRLLSRPFKSIDDKAVLEYASHHIQADQTDALAVALNSDDPHKQSPVQSTHPDANSAKSDGSILQDAFTAQSGTSNGQRSYGYGPSMGHTSSGRKVEHRNLTMELEANDSLRKAKAHEVGGEVDDNSYSLEPTHCRAWSRRLLQNPWFEVSISAIIISNAILIGIEVEYMCEERGGNPPLALKFCGWLHGVVFVLELLFRFVAEGCGFFTGRHWRWNCFDLCVVICTILEVVFEIIAVSADVQSASVVRVARVIRTLRLSRIVRITRLLRFVNALSIMVMSILQTMQSLVWICVLMFMLVYMCGIMFTQATLSHLSDNGWDQDIELVQFWGTLGASMFSLFKSVTGGISWHEVVVPLERLNWIWVWLFLAYVSFCYFAVLNVVTGVFCNSAIENAKREPEMLIQSLLRDKKFYERSLKKLFHSVDMDESGTIGIRELEKSITDPALRAWFEAMGLEIKDAWTLFKLIDEDRSHDITVREFVDQCLHLRGSARGLDLEHMRQELRAISKTILEREGHIENTLLQEMCRIEQCMVSDLFRA